MAYYKHSKFLKVIKGTHKYHLFNSIYGNINSFSAPLYHYFNKVPLINFQSEKGLIKGFLADKLIVPCYENENHEIQKNKGNAVLQASLKKSWSLLRLSVTENCNLCCKYCYINSRGNKNNNKMPFGVASKAIHQFYANFKNIDRQPPVIWFYGGEPLLCESLIKDCIELIIELDKETKKIPDVVITTNGTLFPEKAIDLIINRNVAISISLDGVNEFNDKNRVFKNGKNSFKKVDETIKKFNKKNVNLLAGAVITSDTIKGVLPLIDYCKDNNIRSLSINFPRFLIDMHLDYKKMASLILELESYAFENGVILDGFWRDILISLKCNHSPAFCAAIGSEINIKPDGSIRLCPGYNESIGHVDNLEDIFKNECFLKHASRVGGSIKECEGCIIEGLCSGGCPAELKRGIGVTDRAECQGFREIVIQKLHAM